jgi:hypothetical protein
MLPRIHLDEIAELINGEEYLTSLQKSFYNNYIAQRYEKILVNVQKKANKKK